MTLTLSLTLTLTSDCLQVAGSDPANYFFVDRVSGRVTLRQRLDLERLSNQELSLQVRASTTGSDVLRAVAHIIVTVRDVNDNSPVFSQSVSTQVAAT